ncbi:hypothetical protein L596_001148 [Steinernema carpocapsae]|uniref:Uncharacterized protein n=1 Tax=Steinernema carpocapsae TaxID=34508 RepID=A0A4U8UKF2_STECR|nr:hypothetical protein L596_001148 [Steinernema carpocapsae]
MQGQLALYAARNFRRQSVTNRTLRAQAATIHNVRPGSCQTADYVEILDAAEKQAQDDDIIVGQVIMLV